MSDQVPTGQPREPRVTTPREAAWRRALEEHGPITALVTVAAGVRAFRLGDPPGAAIGDEVWYVQAARVIARLPVLMNHLPAEARSGLDPNSEHPPLAKAIIGGFMMAFGDREVAWRFPSVVLGTLAIWLVYRIVLALRGTKDQALFAAFILTFENLFLIHGRIATLDIYLVTFILVGTLLYLRGYLELAAIAFSVSALCKVNGMLGLLAMFFYEALMERHRWRTPNWRALARRAGLVAIFVGSFLLGLGALDCFFTEYRTPFAHIKHMVSYHAGFKHVGPSTGTESIPFDWWLNAGGFDYYFFTSPMKHILFRAAMNIYVIAAAPLALAFAARQSWMRRSPLGTFAVASLAANFGPVFMAWAVASRTSYIYYMLPSLPAIACAIALLAYASPRSMRWAFAAMLLYGFLFSYPMRIF